MWFAIIVAFFTFNARAEAPAFLDLTITRTAGVNLRLPESRTVNGSVREVLILKASAPKGTVLRAELRGYRQYQWVPSGQHFVQSSFPWFSVEVISLPEGGDRELLGKKFFAPILELPTAKVVAALFDEPLPEGTEKLAHVLPWDAYNPQGTWGFYVHQALDRDVNAFLVQNPPRDVTDFCPRFDSLPMMERVHFWASLVAEIAARESAFVPLTATDEGRYDAGNKGIISTGLTQLSLLSTKASCYQKRGCAEVASQQDLFDPKKNLQCSVAVMSCLTESGDCLSCQRDGGWRGIARYWSTLREPYEVNCPTCPGGKITIGKKREIQAALRRSAAFCF